MIRLPWNFMCIFFGQFSIYPCHRLKLRYGKNVEKSRVEIFNLSCDLDRWSNDLETSHIYFSVHFLHFLNSNIYMKSLQFLSYLELKFSNWPVTLTFDPMTLKLYTNIDQVIGYISTTLIYIRVLYFLCYLEFKC